MVENAQKMPFDDLCLPRGGGKSNWQNYMVNIVILEKKKKNEKEKKSEKKKNEKFWKKNVYVYNIDVLYI